MTDFTINNYELQQEANHATQLAYATLLGEAHKQLAELAD